MHDHRYPTIEGAREVFGQLGIDPNSVDLSCQDWEYTYPQMEQLFDFLELYRRGVLSDAAKRVLGCFIFQTLENHLCSSGDHQLVHDTLAMLKLDYPIHEFEFRYWSLIDLESDERGTQEDQFRITPYVMEYIE